MVMTPWRPVFRCAAPNCRCAASGDGSARSGSRWYEGAPGGRDTIGDTLVTAVKGAVVAVG